MKTKFFSFFAASAMLFAASCSSTDIEESLLPEESVKGESLTVNLTVPTNDIPRSRAVADGWGLRCVLWLVSLDAEGNPVVDESGRKAKMQVMSTAYTEGVSLKFTGVEPGKYAICGFCGYFKDGIETLDSEAPYELSYVGLVNGDAPHFPVDMKSNYEDAANSDNNMINFNNNLYDCWKGKVEFTKDDTNASVSLNLKRAVSKVWFNNNNSSTGFNNSSLASLKIYGGYDSGIDLWSDEAYAYRHSSINYTITDWTGLPSASLVTMYLPKQSSLCSFSLTPTAKPELDLTFKKVTVKDLNFNRVNVFFTVLGNMLIDSGTNVEVDITMDDPAKWDNGITWPNPDIDYTNP